MYDHNAVPKGCVTRFSWARAVKREAYAIYLAARDPRVPWDAKALSFCVAAYVLSPIDLIPDFIPVLGYGDDLIVVSLGSLAVAQLVPPDIMGEHRVTAALRYR
jgi:uncharacterized membrane protein YkvA (DUF1232 family)